MNLNQENFGLECEECRQQYLEAGPLARRLAALIEYLIVIALLASVVVSSFALEIGQ